ncbi:hypothetical protein CLAIMM_02451 [Cladophialophora immunda]|nr:hypothetical protein CLAIMM_02451 [Cladophialophora immunda]
MGSMGVIEEAMARVDAKYAEERQKRLRPEGLAQFEDIAKSQKFQHFGADPWADSKTNKYLQAGQSITVPDNSHFKVIVTGAGYGALLFAVRLMTEADFQPEDFLFVDTTWGFGGTWYWNRYPGLMCDVESACYMPLLEETGYVPKHRYSYGQELRAHAELIAAKYKLEQRALFGSSVQSARWDDSAAEWIYDVTRQTPTQPEQTLTLRSDYFLLASGLLNRPKLPRLQGLDSFKGHVFHTARWDYDYTGGSQESPVLDGLKDKRVAIIGTGATAVQVVPELAKWAQHLYVVQRTPSAVDQRGQRALTPEEFSSISSQRGWQRARRENMAAFSSNLPNLPSEDLVKDGWTSFPSFSALLGSPRATGVNVQNVAEYVHYLRQVDFPRQEGIRARVDEIVKAPKVADSLKPWYYGWCKRPCFHDEYLGTFNLPNVQLLDTDGRGVDGLTEGGIIVDGQEHEIDLLILSTGFESFTVGSPAFRAGLTITGRDQKSMEDKWDDHPGTLHGILTRDFPNLILPGPRQAGSSSNVVFSMDVLATHLAYIFRTARAAGKREDEGKKLVLQPTAEGEENWGQQVIANAYAYAGLPSCTPSYISAEGRVAQTPKEKENAARSAGWGKGILDFMEVIAAWEAKGDLDGVEVRFV